jgi:hypothetical protein
MQFRTLWSMKNILAALTLCCLPLSASATSEEYLKNPPIAENQTLPYGLVLLPGNLVIQSLEAPKQPTGQHSFAVKVPSESGYINWWSEQYGAQLEKLGWKNAGLSEPIRLFNRYKDKCSEQMIMLTLGPNNRENMQKLGGTIPEYEYDLVVFNVSKNGCPASKPVETLNDTPQFPFTNRP